MYDMDKIHKYLTSKMKNYIDIIIKEYGAYMSKETYEKLVSLTDFEHIIKIEDYGNINAHATKNNIYFPLSATEVFDSIKKVIGYGINKRHKTHKQGTSIINKNTFLTYVRHIFISGSTLQDYYDDLLLHETMHYCGCDGGSVLKEGMNEFLTRKLAEKHNLRTNYCAYPKEVELCSTLMDLLGEEIIYKIAFMDNFSDELKLIQTECGEEAAKLYFRVTRIANTEFVTKYHHKTSGFNGVSGVFEKVKVYSTLDYSKAYELINNYCLSLYDIKTKNR